MWGARPSTTSWCSSAFSRKKTRCPRRTPWPRSPKSRAAGMTGWLEAAVGAPLEWDQIMPSFGRREIVKGAIYSYHEFISDHPLNDEEWRARVARTPRPSWVAPYRVGEPAFLSAEAAMTGAFAEGASFRRCVRACSLGERLRLRARMGEPRTGGEDRLLFAGDVLLAREVAREIDMRGGRFAVVRAEGARAAPISPWRTSRARLGTETAARSRRAAPCFEVASRDAAPSGRRRASPPSDWPTIMRAIWATPDGAAPEEALAGGRDSTRSPSRTRRVSCASGGGRSR